MITAGASPPVKVTNVPEDPTKVSHRFQGLWDNPSSPAPEQSRIMTLFAPAPGLEAMPFLRQARGKERFFWSEPGREGSHLTIAGSGIAGEVMVPPALPTEKDLKGSSLSRFDSIAQQARRLFSGAIIRQAFSAHGSARIELPIHFHHLLRPRLFGGFAFQNDFTPDNTWSVFNPAHFILPHYQFVDFNGEKFMAINALIAPDEDLALTNQALEEALAARLALPVVDERFFPATEAPEWRYPMTLTDWGNMIDAATTAIKDGYFDKVVLARVCEIKFEDPIDISKPLAYLNHTYGDCYRFLFEPVPNHAFFGATPELLIRKNGVSLETMALAGSVARGASPAEDKVQAGKLLSSSKDRHEHQLVVDGIKRQLQNVVDQLIIGAEPSVLKLRNIQHLYTPITGELKSSKLEDILDLVELLHPTPALGGSPPAESLAYMRQAERVPRGWYAAPIGWLDDQLDGVFAVAIRSAITQYNRAWLYAGAGIVADSQPDHEWAETQLKFKPMLQALGVNEGA